MPNELIPPNALRGWITPLLQRLTSSISSLSELMLGRRIHWQAKVLDRTGTAQRARNVDWYVFAWFLIELLCYATCANWSDATLRVIVAAVVVLRVIDISSTTMRIAVFDQLALPSGQPMAVASHVRMIVLGVINYFELILCFAVLYCCGAHLIVAAGREKDWFDPFYLSAISQLTIGYGDLHPTSWLRFVACLQGITSMLLIVLLIGRFVALLPHVLSLDDQHAIGAPDKERGTSDPMRRESAAGKESD